MKNILSKAGTFDALFDKFRSYLDGKGLSFNEGKIIDASFVEAPRQRNTREENSDMCKSTKARLSMPLLWKLPGSATPVRRIQICANQQIPAAACLPLWDSRVLTSNNQVK